MRCCVVLRTAATIWTLLQRCGLSWEFDGRTEEVLGTPVDKSPGFGVNKVVHSCVREEQEMKVEGHRCRVKNCGCTAVDICKGRNHKCLIFTLNLFLYSC